MGEIYNPCITVDGIMEKIRQEVAKRKQEEKKNCLSFDKKNFNSPIPSQIDKVIPLNLSPLFLDEPFHTRNSGGYHVNEILKYNNEEFITNAYQAILGRTPDPIGMNLHLNRLDKGTTKIEIIGRLRYGPEGRKKRIEIRGLFMPLIANMLYKFPVVGYLMRLGIAIFRLPKSLREIMEFQNYSFSKNQVLQNYINKNCNAIEESFNQLLEIEMIAQHNVKELQNTLTTLEETLNQELSNKVDRKELYASLAEQDAGFAKIEGTLNQELSNKADREELYVFNEQKAGKDDTNQIRAEIMEIVKQIRDHKFNILDQQQRLRLLLEEVRRHLPEPITTEQIENMLKEEDHFLDAMYVSFEDRFRGNRESIKERQKIYLSYIQKVGGGTKRSPIIDLGCGRGEWLELCRENNLVAKGIDINRVMISECKEYDLDAIEADIIVYLREQKPNSFGAVTGFHIVEHLPLNQLIFLFDEILRVLKPGGIVIFETPNPDNLLVGSRNFYIDPTHRNPLPNETLKYIAEHRGFINIQILNLHPAREYEQIEANVDIYKLLYGPQDYCLMAYKS